MNRGTRISMPVSSVATLVTLPLAVSPRAPGSLEVTRSSTWGGNWRPIGFPLYVWIWTITLSASNCRSSPTMSGLSVIVSKVSWSMKWWRELSEYEYDAEIVARSGSLNFSPALKVRSNTARVSRFRILILTRVCPPRAVGLDTSTSRQWYGAFSYSKYIFRLISIASISLAIGVDYTATDVRRSSFSRSRPCIGLEPAALALDHDAQRLDGHQREDLRRRHAAPVGSGGQARKKRREPVDDLAREEAIAHHRRRAEIEPRQE